MQRLCCYSVITFSVKPAWPNGSIGSKRVHYVGRNSLMTQRGEMDPQPILYNSFNILCDAILNSKALIVNTYMKHFLLFRVV